MGNRSSLYGVEIHDVRSAKVRGKWRWKVFVSGSNYGHLLDANTTLPATARKFMADRTKVNIIKNGRGAVIAIIEHWDHWED